MLRVGHEIHFDPFAMFDEKTGHRLYGAGVQFGDVLRFAKQKTPEGGQPALFGTSHVHVETYMNPYVDIHFEITYASIYEQASVSMEAIVE